MATEEFTPEQQKALDEITRIDEWKPGALDRAVASIMFDGVSFGRAVLKALARAKRPDDPEVTQEKASKIERLRTLLEQKKYEALAKYESQRAALINANKLVEPWKTNGSK